MNERTLERLRKLAASVTAAALLITAPGLETARAAGAVVAALGTQGAPVGVPQVGVVSAALSPLAGTGVGLRLEGLEGGKTLVLPSAPVVRTGSLPSVQGFVPAAEHAAAGTAVLPSAKAAARTPVVAAQAQLQVPAAVVAVPDAVEVPTLRERFTRWFTGAQKGGAVETSRAPSTLGALFENGRRAAALDDAPVAAPADSSPLPSGLAASEKDGKTAAADVPAPQTSQPAAPRSSLSRSVKVGVLMAVLGLVSSTVIPMVAAACGHQFHSNYGSPASIPLHSLFEVAKVATAASVMAPVTEEVIFRGGILGGLSWLAAKYTKSKFMQAYLPAIVSSVVFVAVHETADPVMFAARLVQALLLAAVYQREGVVASMVMHFANNIIPTIGIVSGWLFGASPFAFLGFVLEAAYAWNAFKDLKAERAARADGSVVPYRLTPVRALVLAGVSVIGLLGFTLTLKTTLVWGTAAILLLGYALVQGRKEGWPWKSPDLGALSTARRGVSEEPVPASAQPADAAEAVLPAQSAAVPTAPRRELARSVKYGFVMAVLGFGLNMLLQMAAMKLGLPVPPPTPAGAPAALAALPAAIASVTVMAPIAEEALFRAGLMGGLRKLFGRIPGEFWSFWLPATLSSVAFVFFHMNASPLIALMRFTSSMLLSWTAHHEGIAAAMAQHSISNAIDILLPASAMFGPIGGFTAIALMGSLYMKSRRELRDDEPARAAGEILPYPLTWKSAALLAAVLSAGLFIAPTPLLALIWAAGAAALAGWAGWDYHRTHRSAAASPRADGKSAPGALARLFGGSRRAAQDAALGAPVPAPVAAQGTPWSLKRSLILGFLLAGVQLTLEYVVPLVAAHFGYVGHSNYVAKVFGGGNPLFPAREPSLIGVVGMAFKGGILAPVCEEIIYRAGIMEWLIKGLSWLGIPKAAPWIAGLATALPFVLLHETADPVMIGIRLVGALMLSYAYYKEGLVSSTVMHAIHNGFPGVQAILRVGIGPDAKSLFTVGAALVYAAVSWFLVKILRKGPQGAVANRRYPWPEDVK